MKQKLLYGLMLVVMGLCSVNSWAERVAPTWPDFATLQSGKTYYIYNVDGDKYLYHSGSTVSAGAYNNKLKVQIDLLENGAYTMQFKDLDKGYVYGTSYAYTNSSYDATSSVCYFDICSDGNGYLIQRSPLNTSYYKANTYLGITQSKLDVYCARTTSDWIHWKLYDAEALDKYDASLALYNALTNADEIGVPTFFIEKYEQAYADRANYTAEQINTLAQELNGSVTIYGGYQPPYWNEYPILFTTPDGNYGKSYSYTWALPDNSYKKGSYFYRSLSNGNSSSISATVSVDQKATLVYSLSGVTGTFRVLVDGQEVRNLTNEQYDTYTWNNIYTRFSEVLKPGTHTITWEATSTYTGSYPYFYLRSVGVMKTPTISVSLLEPGSIGTEVLYNTDHIKNVRSLKVKGKMNSDDWEKIKMMATLEELDLSEAEFSEIPLKQFAVTSSDTTMQFLHKLVLPEGLKTIHFRAFYGSLIDELKLPSTLKTIYPYAFYQSHIQGLEFPDDCTDWVTSYYYNTTYYNNVLYNMYWLKNVVLPKNLQTIPYYTLYNDYYLVDVTLPEKLQTIEHDAFYHCQNAKTNFPEGLKTIGDNAFCNCWYADFGAFPESLQSIGSSAFQNCNRIQNLVIPKNVTSIGNNAFQYCYYLKTAELSVNQYAIANDLFDGCTRLETLRLNSPTVATVTESSSSYPVDADKIANVDLIVPSFLVNAYKLHKYWYNFKSITGFSTAEIQDWTINNPLVLNHDRFEGNPNITINGDYGRRPSLKFNGTNAQNLTNLTINSSYNTSNYSGKDGAVIYYNNYPGQIYSNGENIKVNGDVKVNLWTPNKKWMFFSLPFDCKVSDITFSAEEVQYSIAYYDGANRATYGATGSWKKYDKENDVIPASTGFIIQANKDTYCYFKAVDNDTKQNIVAYSEFVKTLEVNDAENKSNKGWNMIGNPYQCFYNSHCLNFTAPITVWNAYNRKYVAYSITDDDYAIRPNEAFFVQCPNEEYNTISFPLQGRQLNDVIESQNAAKPAVATAKTRKLVNVALSNGEQSDETRVVLNEKASMDYEMTCDASKFMSMDNSVPMFFTVGNDGTQYAINERPVADGTVQLGFYAAKSGNYTISLGRNDAEHVYLIDNETGETTEITNSEYSFYAESGTNMSRFVLTFNSGETTGINTVNTEQLTVNNAPVYNLAGQRVQNAQKGIYIINGKKVMK